MNKKNISKKTVMRNILLLTIFSLLIACQQSPQKSYYLLTPLTPQSDKQNVPIDKLLGLGPVELADYLKRPNMVRVRPDNTLNLTTNDFWGEPLDKGIVRVLSLNLVRQDSSRMVLAFPWRSDRIPPHALRISIQELVFSNQQAHINATWELVNTADRKTLHRQHFIRSINAEGNAASIAYAYSELLVELAEEMNMALSKVSQ